MKLHINIVLAGAVLMASPAFAAQDGCPAGSYSVIVSPDHTSVSILFDKFHVERAAAMSTAAVGKVCHISYALNLPADMSLGVYKVDYRGFAKLGTSQQASLDVQYALGPRDNGHGRVFRRKVKGPHEGDFAFTEQIGAGQMKRVGCGADAKLNVRMALELNGSGESIAALDSSDGKSAALVYHLNLKRCN